MDSHKAERLVLAGKNLVIMERIADAMVTEFCELGIDHKTIGELREAKHRLRGVQRQVQLTVHQAEKALAAAAEEVTP